MTHGPDRLMQNHQVSMLYSLANLLLAAENITEALRESLDEATHPIRNEELRYVQHSLENLATNVQKLYADSWEWAYLLGDYLDDTEED